MKQEKRYENVNFSRVSPPGYTSSCKRRKYFWLALIVTKVVMLGIIPAVIISYKSSVSNKQKAEKTNMGEREETLPSEVNVNCFENSIQIFNTDQWTLEKKYYGNLQSAFAYCKESWNTLESIPSVYKPAINNNTRSICGGNFKAFLNADILLTFDRIINKNGLNSLKSIFDEHHEKLSSVKSKKDFAKYLKDSLDSNKIKFYLAHEETYGWDFQLSDFQNVFALVKELRYWYHYLDSLERYMSKYEQQQRRVIYRGKSITEKNFSAFVRENQKSLSCSKYEFSVTEKKLQEINRVISKWTRETSIEKNKTYLKISNKVLLTSEIKEKLKNDSIPPNVYAFASHVLILDEDLELYGTNVALIAPTWIFLRKIKINLNGLDGSKNGEPGEPGYPGGHGGDFLGVGDAEFEFLNVSNKGGNGGPGQDGREGIDGKDFTTPDFLNSPKCILKMDGYDEALNSETAYYKVFNKLGCGKDGEDGGVGGLGGKGGTVLTINKLNEKFRKGSDGTLGTPGKGGKGGWGSTKSCYYRAASVDKNLIPITRITCPYDTISPSGKPGNDNANSRNQLQPSEKINLNFTDPIFKFYEFVAGDLKGDSEAPLAFLADPAIWTPTLIDIDYVKKFRTIKNFKNLMLYELFQREIHLISQSNNSKILDFLEALTRGKILILKEDVDYSFADLNSYLNMIQQNIENVKKDEPGGKYVISFLKTKLDDKLHKISINLKSLKSKLLVLRGNNDDLGESLLEKSRKNEEGITDLITALRVQRSSSVLEIVLDILSAYAENVFRGGAKEEDDIKFKNFVSRQILTFNNAEKKRKEKLESFGEFTASERLILSQFIEGEAKLKKYEDVFRRIVRVFPDLSKEERRLMEAAEKISGKGLKKDERKETLEKVKEAVLPFGESLDRRSELKFLIEELAENLQRLIDLDKLLQWCESEEEFKSSLDNLSLETVDRTNEAYDFLKNELNNVVLEIYYKLAVDALEQKVWPFLQLDRHFRPSNNRTTAEEALFQLQKLHQIGKSTSFCRNKHQATFYSDSTIGEFYHWPNEQIELKMKKLFEGSPVDLKADVDNRHFFDKNLVRMKTVRVEFVCRDQGESRDCDSVFSRSIIHFKVELTHSGYSAFNWKGNVFTVVSDELTLDFSLKTDKNGEPEFYNSVFKRLQYEEMNMSPFATWKIQLFPVNPSADFAKLKPFFNRTDLRLVGVGTFFT